VALEAEVTSELFIFVRFHAKQGLQDAVASSIQEVLNPTRREVGCLSIDAFNSIGDPRLFYIHSRWKDEAAFDNHVLLRHTIRFIEKVQALVDHTVEVTRTRPL
jgi:quinol monooxygenase YgiN